MPNHVYCSITPNTEKGQKALKKIVKFTETINSRGGWLEIIKRMPDELRETTSPNRDQYQAKLMKLEYGAKDWYDWALINWNTKWGAYDQEWDGDSLRFTTAWSPVHLHLIEKLCEYIQDDVFYWWEEEQGFGAEVETINFEVHTNDGYDIPDWGDEVLVTTGEYKEEYWELKTPYYKLGHDYPTGYYANGVVEQEYLSHEDMKELLKTKKAEEV